ncbi:nickel pincer cofactor biosynthesis protein LarC [bacterium]|nr:nickel pincer cofactor biosynthesis protein LarC [bacterium]
MRTAYFDCFAGISGDMTLGALVDAGADFEKLKLELAKLDIKDYELILSKVVRSGISATDIEVRVHHDHGHHGRSFTDIKQHIEQSSLSDSVKAKSIAIFKRLGEAEAKIHGKSIEEIHFHEVGAIDSIIDIVGTCICLALLEIDKVFAGPIPTFHGMVKIAHGTFPLPAPATAEILKDVPWRELGIEGEIVTPTGAAILAELAEGFGPMPAMTLQSTGYGSGKKDFGIPNVLRVMIGEQEEPGHKCCKHPEVAILESNIDDMEPQVYEVVMERLFAAGALDVYLTPIQMKKNRPATLLSVICDPEKISAMGNIIFEETSTIGIRIDRQSRMCLPRITVTVDTKYGQITIKVAHKNGEIINSQPEYEDCKAAAAKHGVPVKLVRDAAIAKFYSQPCD